MSLIRRIRHALWLISYYSADRSRSAWSQAAAVAVICSLPLAVIAAVIFNVVVRDVQTGRQLSGEVVEVAGGDIAARIVTGRARSELAVQGRPIGEFTIQRPIHLHGWPVATSRHPQQAQLDLNLYDQPNTQIAARLDEDSPIRFAIEQSLLRNGETALRDAYRQPPPPAEQLRLGWIVASLMLWAMLAFVLPASIAVLRLLCLLVMQRRAKRIAYYRAKGLCPQCGYDLRGLEFNERCPECGAILD